ncbi:MAG: nitrile hydratase accessory protein [Thermoleophilaceae bacterium]
MEADAVFDAMDGAAALPRSNGELVFEAPWQGRAFGLAVALHERGAFEWDRFRGELVRAIGTAEEGRGYYESWLEALSTVLLEERIVEAAELRHRVDELLAGARDEVY